MSKFGPRFMKDRASTWVNMMAAILAGKGTPRAHHVESGFDATCRTDNFRATKINFHQLFKASGIVRIFGLELLERVF
jgi:hypothetical protein